MANLDAAWSIFINRISDVPSRQLSARWALAGPIAFIAAVLMMAATPVWAPGGASALNNIVIPVVLFPAYWALTFFYGILEERLWRAAAIFGVLIAVNGVLVIQAFIG